MAKFEFVRDLSPNLGVLFSSEGSELIWATKASRGKFNVDLVPLAGGEPRWRIEKKEVIDLVRAGRSAFAVRAKSTTAPESDAADYHVLEVHQEKDGSPGANIEEQDISTVAARPDGSQIAVSHNTGGLRVWNAADGKLLAEREADGTYGVAYSHDGSLLAWRESGSVKIVEAAKPDGKPLKSVKVAGFGELAFHPSELKVAAGKSKSIVIFDAKTGAEEKEIDIRDVASKRALNRITFSPDGKYLAGSTSVEGATGVWNVASGKLVEQVVELGKSVMHLEFDASGRHLLVASFNAAKLFKSPS
jgi:WD40 repeat protein